MPETMPEVTHETSMAEATHETAIHQTTVPRIAFVDHAATPGGGQLTTLGLMQATQRMTPIAVYFTDGPLAQRARDAGIETYVLAPDETFTTRTLVRAVPLLRRALKEIAPDAVVVTSMAAVKTVSAMPPSRVPRVLWLHEDVERMRDRGWVTRSWFHAFLPAFDAFLANSAWTLSTLPRPFRDLPHAVVFPVSGIGAVEDADRTIQPFAGRPVRVASFSRPEEWKGLDLLVEALTRLTTSDPTIDVRLDLYGGGDVDADYEQRLRREVADAPYPAQMHGHVEDVPARMRGTDVMVLPSRLPEPYGTVVAQALHKGCVVVVSGHGGATEQVRDGSNGLWFAPRDADALAATLRRLWDEPDLPQRLSREARASIEPLTDARTVSATEDALIGLVGRVGQPTRRRRVTRRVRGAVRGAEG